MVRHSYRLFHSNSSRFYDFRSMKSENVDGDQRYPVLLADARARARVQVYGLVALAVS